MSQYLESLKEAARFIRDNERFLVISHVSPDGDTTSSACATALILDQLGKSYVIVNEGETPDKFDFLPKAKEIVDLSQTKLNETFSRVIAVDAADSYRMGDVQHLFAPDVQLLNIDHHPTNDKFGTYNVIRTDAAATAEMMYELVEAGEFELTPEIATCIYTGLMTDTGGFRYSNTTSNVMKIASKLLEYGVKPAEIAERCLEAITKEHVQLLRRALQSLSITHNNLVASLKVTLQDIRETGATGEDVSGLVNYGRNIEGVEVGLLFTEVEPDVIKVSLRSRSKVDVSQIAKSIGGGGHARASGCTVKGSISEVEDRLLGMLGEALGVNR
ncbi:DHH family phosphoesterase [Brevibacillus dissolubilis]|uniref:DHH family phosphoesterase n=1 Tax=Brevibacillus dissolubilis TaxID=1844116 RepID=UPI001115F6D0|nr:bifunctional oligoribonuclease/PAP phosphatase NrnA [Brevibacillus dissolubilis]